ncbi:MAG: DUF421 domain-containing protein [Candidatus Limnocylindrales bacterium]
MFTLTISPLELVARSVLVYVAFFAGLRLFGKREIGQFTLFDLALVLLAANAVQPAVTGPDSSVPGGVIILATLFATNRLVAEARTRVPWFRRIVEFEPTVIGRDGAWLTEVVKREGLDLTDCDAALREHGIDDVGQVRLATLEEDGSISIVPIDGVDVDSARRRRRRSRRVR